MTGHTGDADTAPERPGAGSVNAGTVPAGIARAIAAEGGRVTFARFMELVSCI